MTNSPPPFDRVIGLDRSDQKADLCWINPHPGERRTTVIAPAPEALWEGLLELRQHPPTARVGLCLEPSLPTVQKAQPATRKAFYYRHGSRRAKRRAERLALVAQAVAVTDETAGIGSFVLRGQRVCRQRQLGQRSGPKFHRQSFHE